MRRVLLHQICVALLSLMACAAASAADLGSLGNGTTDAAPALNAALRERQHVLLPCGQYRLNAPLVLGSGTSLRGTSRACTILLLAAETGDGISFGDGTTVVSGAELSALHIFAPSRRTSGFAVVVRRGHFVRLTDVTIDGFLAGGVRFDGSGGGSFGNRLDNFEISSASEVGIRLTGYVIDTFINKGVVGASPLSLHLNDASGIYLSDVDFSPSTGNAGGAAQPTILVNPGRGQNVNSLRATTVLADSCDGDCWQFAPAADGTSGGISEVSIVGSWGGGSVAGSGLHIRSGADVNGMVVTGFDAHLNARHGLAIEGGRNIVLSAVQSFNNGRDANVSETGCNNQSYAGILVGRNATRVSVVAAQAGPGGYMAQHGKRNCQALGLDAGEGSDDPRFLSVIGGQFEGATGRGRRMPSGPGIVDLGNLPP